MTKNKIVIFIIEQKQTPLKLINSSKGQQSTNCLGLENTFERFLPCKVDLWNQGGAIASGVSRGKIRAVTGTEQ